MFLKKIKRTATVIGDLNYPGIDWASSYSSDAEEMKMLDCMVEANLTQLISGPTHILGNTLDVVLTNTPATIESIGVDPVNKLSDHYLIKAEILTEINRPASVEKVFNLSKANFNEMRRLLGEVNWHKMFATKSAELCWIDFRDTLNSVMDE